MRDQVPRLHTLCPLIGEIEKARRRDPASAYSTLGAARRAVSGGRRAPGLTIPLWPARGMVEIGRKDDSWQKPACTRSARSLAKLKSPPA
jgi:hypothetical protein